MQVCRPRLAPNASVFEERKRRGSQNSQEHWSQNQARGAQDSAELPDSTPASSPVEPPPSGAISAASSLLRRNCSEFFSVGPSPSQALPCLSGKLPLISGVAVTPARPVLPCHDGDGHPEPSFDRRQDPGGSPDRSGGSLPAPPPGPDSGLLSDAFLARFHCTAGEKLGPAPQAASSE